MMRSLRVLHGCLLALAAGVPQALAGQGAPEAALEAPEVLAGPFSQVRGLRELGDGRILVSDWIEEAVWLIDPGTGRRQRVGDRGQGPKEYLLPERLIALAGDSTLLVDMGNSRLAVLGPEGAIRRAFSSRPATVRYGITPGGADARGRLYFVIPRWARGLPPTQVDSVAPVARWHPDDGTVDTLLTVWGITPRSDAGQPRHTPGLPYVPFAPRDAWRVAIDGSVVVVRARPYRVEGRTDGGTWWQGPALDRRPRRVTESDRKAFVRRFLAWSPISGRGPNGGLGHTPTEQMTEAAVAEMVANNEFAEWVPPFDPASVWLAPDGELWVGRWVSDGEVPRYDVFDGRGRPIREVTLPPGRRIVGLGHSDVFLVSVDADGLETLERAPRPSREP